MMMVGVYSFWTTASAATSTADRTIATATVDKSTVVETKPPPVVIEAVVTSYFADTPVMIEIAKCESKFRQYTDAGNVFYGGAGGGMVGIFQFYESIHKTTAAALGYDLATVDGNIAYAKHLYKEQGVTPWQSCVPTTPILDANTQKRIELMKQIIGLLQQLLALKLAEE
ncbi:MAG: hypothetical protein RLZZ360_408 [Candidatus Parcubacteria bacterium]|jgi:hypothetical protein